MEAQRNDHAPKVYLKSFPTSNYTQHKNLYPHNHANILFETVLPLGSFRGSKERLLLK